MDSNHNCSSICLANSADRLIDLLSIDLVGRAGVAPATQEAAVLQTVAHADRRADLCLLLLLKDEQDLAVPTGVEPANAALKVLWLYRFAYGTKF